MSDKLYRSRSDGMIGGVAAGVAHYFHIDPTIVRLVWALAVFFGGTGLLLYAVAWIIIPASPEGMSTRTFERTEQIRQQIIDTAKDVEGKMRGVKRETDDLNTIDAENSDTSRHKLLGVVLIIIGLFFLLRTVMSWISFEYVWPLVAIVTGGILILRSSGR